MQTVAEAQTKAQVQEFAEGIAAVLGADLENPGLNASSCEGRFGESSDEIYSVMGAYNVRVPHREHPEAVGRLRAHLRERGYRITDDRVVDTTHHGKGYTLKGEDPDGYSVRLRSTVPPTHLALTVHSSCRRSPTPRY